MKYNTILVPYDGSDAAKDAVHYATEMVAGNADGKIVAFASLAGPHDINRLLGGTAGLVNVGGGKNVVEHYQKIREDAIAENMERLKREVGEIAGETPVEYNIDYSVSPVTGILKAAETFKADAIVMGSRGASAIAGVLGSTAFGVVRGATIPVTVVK